MNRAELRTTWIVLRTTLREGVRRRLLVALAALSALAILLTAWGYAQLPNFGRSSGNPLTPAELQAIASQLLIVVMFMFSWTVTLGAVFAAAPSVAGELESGEMLAVLARPISRRSVLLGKWLALGAVVLTYAVCASLLEFGAVWLATGYLPPGPLPAALYLAGEGLVMLVLTMALSTRLAPVTAGIVAMLIFGVAWLAGFVGGIGQAFGDPISQGIGAVGRVLVPTDGLWRAAIFHLEPPAVILARGAAGPEFAAFPFFADAPPSLAYHLWVAAWMITVLALASWSFGRRDL